MHQLVAGKYRLVRRLARGGMGAVWQAFHVDLQADVALKFIRPESDGGARSLARFQREARVLAQLRSPHIVQVLDFGVDDQAPYIAMELLEGEDLALLLARRVTLTPSETLSVILEAARGLRVAHQAGVIHRDIKPSNLFGVQGQGTCRIKLIDFGIAKVAAGDSSEKTTEGLVLGSPAFMSPEQARGAEVDASADVWSLAAVAFRMLTGRAPIEGTSPSDTVVRICTESPPLVSALRPELGSAFDELFDSTFRRNILERLVDLDEFARRMRAALLAHDPRAVAPNWVSESSAEVRADSISRSVAESDAAPAAAHMSSGRGRDSETASISLARNAPPPAVARASTLPHWTRWIGVGAAAVVVLTGWWISVERSSPTSQRSSALAAPQASGSQLGAAAPRSADQVAPVESATAVGPSVQPGASAAVSDDSASAAPTLPQRRSTAVHQRLRTTLEPKKSPPLDPATPATEPTKSPDRDPVFGLPVSEP